MVEMNDKKVRLALLGKDVSKSLSEEVHTFILNAWGVDCDYERVSIDVGEFDNAMRYLLGDFDGFQPFRMRTFQILRFAEIEINPCHSTSNTGTKKAEWRVTIRLQGKKMVAAPGIEPGTHGFSVHCSTN